MLNRHIWIIQIGIGDFGQWKIQRFWRFNWTPFKNLFVISAFQRCDKDGWWRLSNLHTLRHGYNWQRNNLRWNGSNHCNDALKKDEEQLSFGSKRDEDFEHLIERVKSEGRGKPYDRIMGSVVLTARWLIRVQGFLRPRCPFWQRLNELAVDNTKLTIESQDWSAHHVVDCQFRDLQQLPKLRWYSWGTNRSRDFSAFVRVAAIQNSFYLTGSNLVTERGTSYAWGIKTQVTAGFVRRFWNVKLKHIQPVGQFLYYVLVKGIKQIPLEFCRLRQSEGKGILIQRTRLRDYVENTTSLFGQGFPGYYLQRNLVW